MTGRIREMSIETLLTRREAAEFLGVSPSTLARWAMEGTGPAYFKTGSVRYRVRDLEAFIESRRVEPVREARR